MTINQSKLTDVRDYALNLFSTNVTTLEYGSNTTTPTASDAGCLTLIGTTTATADTAAAGTVKFRGSIGISTGNGNTVAEIALTDGVSDDFSRDLTVPRAKVATEIFRFTNIVGATVVNKT